MVNEVSRTEDISESSRSADEVQGNDVHTSSHAPSYDDQEESDDEDPLGGFNWIEGDTLAPPCQSEPDTVHEILKLGRVGPGDVVYDLGCGDGRICIAAVEKFGAARAVGIEIEPKLIEEFKQRVEEKKLGEKVRVMQGDLRELVPWSDLDHNSVIVTYLLPEALSELQSRLEKAVVRQGCRLVCNTWGLPPVSSSSNEPRQDKGDDDADDDYEAQGIKPVDRADVGPFKQETLLFYRAE